MPFGEDVFDCIYCRATFKNFSDPAVALNKLHRVLKPGGEAVIIDLAPTHPTPRSTGAWRTCAGLCQNADNQADVQAHVAEARVHP